MAGESRRKEGPANAAPLKQTESFDQSSNAAPLPRDAGADNLNPVSQSPPPLRFGDPDSIARRGPVRDRKVRMRNPRSKQWKRFAPIWQRIEGEWKRYFCTKCRAVSWRVLDQQGPLVHVRCPRGHKGIVMAGFRMEPPDDS